MPHNSTAKSYDFHTSSLPLKSHCHIVCIPRFISLHIRDVVCWHNTSRKAKAFTMHWTTLGKLTKFCSTSPGGLHGPTSDLPSRIRCLVVLGGRRKWNCSLVANWNIWNVVLFLRIFFWQYFLFQLQPKSGVFTTLLPAQEKKPFQLQDLQQKSMQFLLAQELSERN